MVFNDQLLYKCNFNNVITVLPQSPLRCCFWFLVVLDCSLTYGFACLSVCLKELIFYRCPYTQVMYVEGSKKDLDKWICAKPVS